MGNDRLSGKQVGSQASRRVTWRLAWIQPVCISINAVTALKGLINPLYYKSQTKFTTLVISNPHLNCLEVSRENWIQQMVIL